MSFWCLRLREGPGSGLGEVGGVHITRHVGLLLEFGLQQRVLDDADPHVHLNDLLLQLCQTLLDLHHWSCGTETEEGNVRTGSLCRSART